MSALSYKVFVGLVLEEVCLFEWGLLGSQAGQSGQWQA